MKNVDFPGMIGKMLCGGSVDMDWRHFFQNVLDAAWILEKILEALPWVLLCRGLPRKWEDWVQSLAELAVAISLFFLLGAVCVACCGDMVHFVWALLHGGLAAAYLYAYAPYGHKTAFVLWTGFFAVENALVSLGGQLSFLAGTYIRQGVLEGVIRVTFHMIKLPLVLVLRQMNLDEFGSVPKSGMTMLIAGDVGLMLLSFAEAHWLLASTGIVTILAITYFCMLCMEVMACACLYQMCREQAEILNLQAEQQRLLGEQETMMAAQTRIDELRSIRHDLKNQYAYMQILLEGGRYQELERYFGQVSQAMPLPLNYVDCGNRVINSILNMEIGKAKRENVSITHQLVVPPVLPFSEVDLCAILANLLDNSIEECCRMRNTTGVTPEIHLEIYPQKSYLLIVCSNATDRESLERRRQGIRTTKGDDNLHGFGTRIITKTAERNNGCADFRLENGRFISTVMLDLMGGQNNAN